MEAPFVEKSCHERPQFQRSGFCVYKLDEDGNVDGLLLTRLRTVLNNSGPDFAWTLPVVD